MDLVYVGEVCVVDNKNIVYISEIPFYSGFPKDIVNQGVLHVLQIDLRKSGRCKLIGDLITSYLQLNAGITLQIRPLLLTSTCVEVLDLLITLSFDAI